MCTDASALGIGAVLMQTVEGNHPHVIVYASRTFTHAESRYSVAQLSGHLSIFVTLYFDIQLYCTLIIVNPIELIP